MKRKMKLCADAAMTALLLLLMAFERIGAAAHEWLGIFMFVLVIVHHVFNMKWTSSLTRGKYPPIRMVQTVLVVLLLLSMLDSMISGVMLSRHALSFLPVHSGTSWARTLHMLCTYWGFVLMGIHLGLHWNIKLGRTWIFRAAGVLIAAYGVYAFVKRDIHTYMLLRSHFVFFDFSEPLVLFLLDYLAIMGMLVWAGYYLRCFIRYISYKNTI